MNQIYCLIIAILLTTTACTQLPKSIETYLAETHKSGKFNGNALVLQNGKTIYEKSFGYASGAKNEPLTKDHRFNIGSIYKEFPAVAIMQLVGKNELRLEDKLATYVSDLPDWSKEISIKNLLQYSSGLPMIDWNKYFSKGETVAIWNIWNDLKNIEQLEFAPGTDYLYTNYSPLLLIKVIEEVTGPHSTFDYYANNHLFPAAGMTQTIIKSKYPYRDKRLMAIPFDSDFEGDNYEVSLSGMLFCSTARDLANWFESIGDFKLINEQSTKFLSETAKPGADFQSPLGVAKWDEKGLIEYTHHGSIGNYECLVQRFEREDLTIVILTNRKRQNLGELVNGIYKIVNNEIIQNK